MSASQSYPDGVSFVVTVYNKRPFLENMVGALKAQDGDYGRQFVFIDDGSTDGSFEALERLAASLPGAEVHTQDNAGSSAATTKGGMLAKLKWIKFCDGDDVIAPWAGRWAMEAAEAANVDGLWCRGKDRHLNAAYPDLGVFGPCPEHRDVTVLTDPLYTVIREGLTGMSNVMVRTEAFHGFGGCDDSVFVQENSLVLRTAGWRRRLAVADDVALSAVPPEAPGRISDNKAQLLHDTTLAFANFLRDDRNISDRYRRLAARRALGRAWKWRRREAGKSLLDEPLLYLTNLWASARLPLAADWAQRLACRAIAADHEVRLIP